MCSSCLPAFSGSGGSTERKRWAQSGRTLLSLPDPAQVVGSPQHLAEHQLGQAISVWALPAMHCKVCFGKNQTLLFTVVLGLCRET